MSTARQKVVGTQQQQHKQMDECYSSVEIGLHTKTMMPSCSTHTQLALNQERKKNFCFRCSFD